MSLRLLRFLSAVFIVALLGACASKPVSADKPVLRKIALIPATEPAGLTLVNENKVMSFLVPISSAGYYLDSKGKAKLFNDRIASRHLALAQRLTSTIVDALRAAGYTVDVLQSITRNPEEPDSFDFETVATDAEAILQVRIDEVGVYSSTLSNQYLPRVNLQGRLYVKSIDDTIYDENLYFGADAKKGKPFMIESEAKFAYPTFDTLMGKTDEIGDAFEGGIDALARMVATQLIEALATRTRPAPPG
jgi:hypothetical protein